MSLILNGMQQIDRTGSFSLLYEQSMHKLCHVSEMQYTCFDRRVTVIFKIMSVNNELITWHIVQ